MNAEQLIDKMIEGSDEPGKRDGSGPFKGSFQAKAKKGIGKRKARGEKCPKSDDDNK